MSSAYVMMIIVFPLSQQSSFVPETCRWCLTTRVEIPHIGRVTIGAQIGQSPYFCKAT